MCLLVYMYASKLTLCGSDVGGHIIFFSGKLFHITRHFIYKSYVLQNGFTDDHTKIPNEKKKKEKYYY